MKSILILSTIFLTSCFHTEATETKAQYKALIGETSYRCRVLRPSRYNCGVDLFDCVTTTGYRFDSVICATNVTTGL